MIYLVLAGPLLAMGFLLLMQVLERWLVQSLRRDRRIGGRIDGRGGPAAYDAFDTEDMLKSATRQVGIAVRVK
jgi:hypothetical protein